MPVSALGIRRDRMSMAAAMANISTSGAKRTSACHVMGQVPFPFGHAAAVRGGGLAASHAAVERSPAAQDLGPDGADDRDRSDDDQAGDQCVFQHFAASFIAQQPSYKGAGVAHGGI